MEETKKSWLEILVELLKSRTVWSAILYTISMLVYFRTGGVLQTIGIDSPDVTAAVNSASFLLSMFSGFAIPYFRLLATKNQGKTASKASEMLQEFLNDVYCAVKENDGKVSLDLQTIKKVDVARQSLVKK